MAQLSDYEIGTRFARGGMAELFLARARTPRGHGRGDGEWVAIKQLLPELEARDEFVDMFLEEGKLAVLLRHPNIVSTFEVGTLEGRHTIVMELLRGKDLRKLARASLRAGVEVPLDVSVFVATSVCAGLHEAHEAVDGDGKKLRVVHRDVSPQNVFVSDDGTVKVVDFGIAKSDIRGFETQGGMLKGKVPYMAPEQIKCEAIDRRADVYAVGVMLYECLFGTRPYSLASSTEFALMLAIAKHDIVAPCTRNPSFPKELERIVLRALAFKANDRYETCDAMREDLLRFARAEGFKESCVGAWVGAIAGKGAATAEERPAVASGDEIGFGDAPRLAGEHPVVFAVERVGSVTVVRFEGRIDELFRGREIAEALSGQLVFDLTHVERISSYGVRAWLEMMSAIPKDAEVHLYRCSEAIVGQLGSSAGFAGPARVVSFQVPLVCEDCGSGSMLAIDLELHATELHAGTIPDRRCERCSGKCRLDDDPSALAFARKHMGSPIAAQVRRAVSRLDRRHESGVGDSVEKIVTPAETRVVVKRPSRKPIRWRKALDGVEGRLTLDLRGVPSMDGPSAALLVSALDSLGADVESIEIHDCPLVVARLYDERMSGLVSVKSILVEAHCAHCRARRSGRIERSAYLEAVSRGQVPEAPCRRCGGLLGLSTSPYPSEVEPAESGISDRGTTKVGRTASRQRSLRWLGLAFVASIAILVALTVLFLRLFGATAGRSTTSVTVLSTRVSDGRP